MLERARTEAKILGPLSAKGWQVGDSASAESQTPWVEGRNKSPASASQSEGYSCYSGNILDRRLDTVLGYGN